MLPAEKLRIIIEKLHNIDLEKYAWPEELKNEIFAIQLDKILEENANTLEEIYVNGFNIGHCGLTSRYVIQKFKDASLHYGICKMLVGTKSSNNGNHAWVEHNEFLIDTTLMLCIPLDKKNTFGYETKNIIDRDSALLLSEYDIYDNDFYEKKHNLNFNDELYNIKR